ncbi:MAG: DUF3786 domain-containing protein [Lachnospiraceae bacterium]|jgi:hypothetical protein|nr:DUF3786 domain-containing protein [Lachnospiraceae bacterium]RKJ49199.1 DUF3786 domain-containing protein [bacterium 1XD42-54]
MKEKRASNYEKLCEDWRLKFLELDQEKLCRRLPELKQEGEYLTLFHFGQKYGVHRQTGQIFALSDWLMRGGADDKASEALEEVSVNVRLDIYNLFWYSKETAYFQNRWVPFRELKNAGPFAPAFEKNILKPLAATFEGKPDKLREAAQALGGEMLSQADVGFILPCFVCIPMQFLFWDGDDEFPAQANILFDYSATDYIHVESTVTLATEGLVRLKKAAGLPLRGTTFEIENGS